MTVMIGSKYRVYLEDGNGHILEVDAISASISHSLIGMESVRAEVRTEINLIGTGPMLWRECEDFVKEKKSATEWKCDFCGMVNPRAARYCGELGKHAHGCGASRSFVYDE